MGFKFVVLGPIGATVGQALSALAGARRQQGRHAEAAETARAALLIHEEAGHEPGRRETEHLLAGGRELSAPEPEAGQ